MFDATVLVFPCELTLPLGEAFKNSFILSFKSTTFFFYNLDPTEAFLACKEGISSFFV